MDMKGPQSPGPWKAVEGRSLLLASSDSFALDFPEVVPPDPPLAAGLELQVAQGFVN